MCSSLQWQAICPSQNTLNTAEWISSNWTTLVAIDPSTSQCTSWAAQGHLPWMRSSTLIDYSLTHCTDWQQTSARNWKIIEVILTIIQEALLKVLHREQYALKITMNQMRGLSYHWTITLLHGNRCGKVLVSVGYGQALEIPLNEYQAIEPLSLQLIRPRLNARAEPLRDTSPGCVLAPSSIIL